MFHYGNNLENLQNDVRMKPETYNTVIEKSKDKLKKDTSFIRRNYPVFWVALALYALATCISASSIFAHLNIRMGETFVSWIAVVLAGVGTVVVIFMQFMLKFFVDDLQAGAHNKGGGDFAMMVVKAIVGVAGIGFGIMLSLGGADKVVGYVAKQNTDVNVDLISIDSIQNYYDQRRTEYQRAQTAYLNTKWKGNITTPALKQSAKINDILENVENERAAAIAQAEAKNNAAMDEYKTEVQGNKAQARGWMGIAEGLIVLCIILIGIFDDGVKREAKNIGVRVEQDF